MHLIERYALSTASKIDKPYIYEQFFPLPWEKFITFQAQSKFESKDYQYFQDVIDLIAPVLQAKGIFILQFGTPKEALYRKVIDLRGQTTFNQAAYIMRHSMLHLGPDSFGIHLASMYDVPIVGLYSCIQSSNAGPYFGDPAKHVLFEAYERTGNKKPSYAPQENPRSINLIKPEEIANGIFQLLGLPERAPFETVFVGKKYINSMIRELVPDTQVALNNPDAPVEIRTDVFYDEKLLSFHLSYLKHVILSTDKPINIQLLRAFKPNIKMVTYKITENDNPEFVKELVSNGFPCLLLSALEGEKLDSKKIAYYNLGRINPTEKVEAKILEDLKKNIDKLHYRSNKLTASDGKVFASHAAREANIPLKNDGEFQKAIDSPKFWEDLDFFTIIRMV